MSSLPRPRLLRCGDAAISVEFGDSIDPATNARVLALDAALAAESPVGVVETVPTYRSLLVYLDPLLADSEALSQRILELSQEPAGAGGKPRRWRVPIVYGGEFGMDLEELAARHGISAETLVARHCEATYVVAMIGFMPGFAYLGGLDPALTTPRRLEPRPLVPAQSISIGGGQSAISTVAGPSGWHMIGRTPVRGFMPGRAPLFVFAPGDEIRFERIAAGEWPALDALAEEGAPIARCETP
jgi:KipI family sensor histidine kinase inhibitor